MSRVNKRLTNDECDISTCDESQTESEYPQRTPDLQSQPLHDSTIDDDAPYPNTVQREKMVMPQIQTMSGYIQTHYESEILYSIKQHILSGELGVRYKDRILHARAMPEDKRGTDIQFVSGKITKMYFRRAGYQMVYAGLTIRVVLKMCSSPWDEPESVIGWYRGDIWLDMEGEEINARSR